MNHRQSELKGKIMAAAEEAMEAVLDWDAAHPASDFGEIEGLILQVRQRLGARMTQALLEAQSSRRPVPGPVCATCGQEMHYKGDKTLGFGSLVGEIATTRGYYYCDHCERGLFPPGCAVSVAREALECGSGAAGDVAEWAAKLWGSV